MPALKIKHVLVCFFVLVLFISGCSAGNGAKSGDLNQSLSSSRQAEENVENSPDTPSGDKQEAADSDQDAADAAALNINGTADEDKGRNANDNNVQLSGAVTKNFGRTQLSTVHMEGSAGSSLMVVLKAHMDIETAYGGSFINSVNGIASDSGNFTNPGSDWFLYINGICCDTGAGDYVISAGDSVWLDFHHWERGPANAAVIGLYPEPFLHGYRGKVLPVCIMSDEGNQDLAQQLSKSLTLRGVKNVTVVGMNNDLLMKRQGPTIVMGEWSALQHLAYLKSLNDAYGKNGMGIHFTQDGVELLDYTGKKADFKSGGTGIIAASGEGLGDASPLWLVSGTDSKGYQQAVKLLLNYSGELAYFYSAAVCEGQVIHLPITN